MEVIHQKEDFEKEKLLMLEQHNATVEELQYKLSEQTKLKEAYFIELQRRKGETNNLYEGGFGTFTLAFENPFYSQLIEKQAALANHRQNIEMMRTSLKGKKKKQKNMLTKYEEMELELVKEVEKLQQNVENMTV